MAEAKASTCRSVACWIPDDSALLRTPDRRRGQPCGPLGVTEMLSTSLASLVADVHVRGWVLVMIICQSRTITGTRSSLRATVIFV